MKGVWLVAAYVNTPPRIALLSAKYAEAFLEVTARITARAAQEK